MFLRLTSRLTFFTFHDNLFYEMQSKFQNKFVLPKKTFEVHFITSLHIFSVELL
jgi:hypothetical protein